MSYSFSPSLSSSPTKRTTQETNPPTTPIMAVEAHHLHLFPSQQLTIRNDHREMNTNAGNCDAAAAMAGFASAPPPSAAAAAGGGGGNYFMPFYVNSLSADASESTGLTFHDLSNIHVAGAVPSTTGAGTAARKRPRVAGGGENRLPFSFLGEDISVQIQQQQLELDRLVAIHAEKVRAEVWERRRRAARRVAAAVEAAAAKRILAKEEEIDRVTKLNSVLENRVQSLSVENHLWRELARSNETAAAALRHDLDQALAAAAAAAHHHNAAGHAGAAPPPDDVESFCDNDNDNNHDGGGGDEAAAEGGGDGRRRAAACRRCEEGEPSVLLLPCRHLCLCSACGPHVNTCPICRCEKNGSVNVNMA